MWSGICVPTTAMYDMSPTNDLISCVIMSKLAPGEIGKHQSDLLGGIHCQALGLATMRARRLV